jgi:PncC family amidohydrolase
VSRETAVEMSSGLEELLGSDISLSVTGIAGPAGGTEEKPVGTVFIGVKIRNKTPHVEGFQLKGLDRTSFKREVSRISLGLMLGHASQM